MKKIICTIIYNEQDELEEWIKHHLSIGFDSIYLFEDYNSISHKDITDKYDEVYLSSFATMGITNTNSPQKQLNLYKEFLKCVNTSTLADWIAFIDIDEYITFEDGYNLDTLLKEFENETAIYLCWKNFNASGHLFKKPADVTNKEYYTTEVDSFILHKNIETLCKSIVNVKLCKELKSNHIAVDGVFTDHEPLKHRLQRCYDKAWINHYFYKSWEDWCYRMFIRGNMHNNLRTFDTWFEANPEFIEQEETMLNEIRNKHLRSTYTISNKHKLISGGNIDIINKLIEERNGN